MKSAFMNIMKNMWRERKDRDGIMPDMNEDRRRGIEIELGWV